MAQHGTWRLSNQPLLEQVCSLSWKETLPHHSEILSANRTWEMVPVNSFQGLASFTYLARTCRDVQGLLQQLPLLVFLYAYLIIFSLICRSSLLSQQVFVDLSLTITCFILTLLFINSDVISCEVCLFVVSFTIRGFHAIHRKGYPIMIKMLTDFFSYVLSV